MNFQLYVEEFGLTPDVQRYVNDKNAIYVDINNRVFYTYPVKGLKKFVEIVYESAMAMIFDLENKKTICKTVVVEPNTKEALMTEENIDIEIIEAKGRQLFPLVRVGQRVDKYSRLCYIVTRKYEVRVLKSFNRGIVFYIGEVFPRERKALYIIIIGEENVIKLARAS